MQRTKEKKKTRQQALKSLNAYELMGWSSFEDGKLENENQYVDYTQAGRDWLYGWEAARQHYGGRRQAQ